MPPKQSPGRGRPRSKSPAATREKSPAGKRNRDETANAKAPKSVKKTEKVYAGISHNSVEDYEFGGPWGVAALIMWSHYILFYFW